MASAAGACAAPSLLRRLQRDQLHPAAAGGRPQQRLAHRREHGERRRGQAVRRDAVGRDAGRAGGDVVRRACGSRAGVGW